MTKSGAHSGPQERTSTPTVTPLDQWAELERLAKAATPGPYRRDRLGSTVSLYAGSDFLASMGTRLRISQREANAAFFIAVNPSAVLKLIAAARANASGYERQRMNNNPAWEGKT